MSEKDNLITYIHLRELVRKPEIKGDKLDNYKKQIVKLHIFLIDNLRDPFDIFYIDNIINKSHLKISQKIEACEKYYDKVDNKIDKPVVFYRDRLRKIQESTYENLELRRSSTTLEKKIGGETLYYFTSHSDDIYYYMFGLENKETLYNILLHQLETTLIELIGKVNDHLKEYEKYKNSFFLYLDAPVSNIIKYVSEIRNLMDTGFKKLMNEEDYRVFVLKFEEENPKIKEWLFRIN